jgi:hypothetical protein
MKAWGLYAKTGTDNKGDYKPARLWRNGCCFCEFLGYSNRDCKRFCPGFNYWVTPELGVDSSGHCMDNDYNKQISLFKHWERAKTKAERQLWAKRIVWMIWLVKEHMEGRML